MDRDSRDTLHLMMNEFHAAHPTVYNEICKYLDFGGYEAVGAILGGDQQLKFPNTRWPNGNQSIVITSAANTLGVSDGFRLLGTKNYDIAFSGTTSNPVGNSTIRLLITDSDIAAGVNPTDYTDVFGYLIAFQINFINEIAPIQIRQLDGTASGITLFSPSTSGASIEIVEFQNNITISYGVTSFSFLVSTFFGTRQNRYLHLYHTNNGTGGLNQTLNMI